MWPRLRLLLVAPMVVGLAACAADDEPEAADPTGAPTVPPSTVAASPTVVPPTEFDPPIAFGDPVELGRPWHDQYTVHDSVAYFFSSGGDVLGLARHRDLNAVDLLTGESRWVTSIDIGRDGPPQEFRREAYWPPPMVGEVDGRLLVFVTHPVSEAGTGTRLDRHAARVVALDASDGSEVWAIDFEATRVNWSHGYLRPVGVTEDTLVVTAEMGFGPSDDREPVTYGLDAVTGRERWRESGFVAELADRGVVVGWVVTDDFGFSTEYAIQGRDAADGARRWQHPDLFNRGQIDALGPGLAAYRARTEDPDSDYGVETRVISVEDGDVVAAVDGGFICRDDHESVIVCRTTDFFQFDDHMVAFDRDSGELLWELVEDESDRAVPRVLSLRPGVIYAEGPRSMVLLDARTGEDLIPDLATYPGGRVVPGFAVVVHDGVLYAYPATG